MRSSLLLCMCGGVAAGAMALQPAHAESLAFDVFSKITGDSADATVHVIVDDETEPGKLKVTAEIVSPLADIRGLFFHVSDESLLGGLSVSGDDVTDSRFSANAVDDLGQGANVQGGGAVNPGPFDLGVEIGGPGLGGGDDIMMTMFTLTHDSEALTVDFLAEQAIGVRLTSVGFDGARDGSSKLTGLVPPPTGVPIPEPASAALLVAGLGCVLGSQRGQRA